MFSRNPHTAAARQLYEAVVAQSRQPELYRGFAVPDSVDGRFEMLLLHSFLVFNRLKGQGDPAKDFGQTLFDLMVFHLDQSIRVSGVGDLKVGPRLKAMGEAFYGRSQAYETALASEQESSLEEALARNVYGSSRDEDSSTPGEAVLKALAGYTREAAESLAEQPLSALLSGHIEFPRPQEPAASERLEQASHG